MSHELIQNNEGVEGSCPNDSSISYPPLDSLNLAPTTLNKLRALEQTRREDILPFLSQRYAEGSLRSVARETGISPQIVAKILRKCGKTVLTRAEATRQNWQDEDFRRRQAEAARRDLSGRWQDEDFRRGHAARTKLRWKNEEFRERNAAGTRQRWQDEDFRRRNAEGRRQELSERWQDEDFRRRQAARARQVRLNPDNLAHYVLPTIYGDRNDVGFCQSAWEANICRIFDYLGREYYRHETVELTLPQDDESNQQPIIAAFDLDFVVMDPRGNVICYEIMAHPLEHPEGWRRLELLTDQHPEITIRVITRRFYERLRRRFEDRINRDPNLAGWETNQNNLRTNPDQFS